MSDKYTLFLQPYVKKLIREELSRRQSASKSPVVASKNEIMKQVHEDINCALEQLENDGIITHSENVNGIYLYRFKDKK